MGRIAAALALTLLLAAGCGGGDGGPPPAPPLPSSTLPELTHRDRALPLDELAQDALQPDDLAALLSEAGYRGGSEREFSGHGKTFDHVIARTLSFADRAGADRYLVWVRAHARDLAGPSRPVRVELDAERVVLFELEPCPTCKKQLPTIFGAWRRGSTVSYLLTAGRDVGLDTFADLAGSLGSR